MEFITMFIQLIIALSITLGLMFLSYKVLGAKVNKINENKYIKVIERVQVTKDSNILVVKVGKKGYVMTSTTGHMDKLSELSEEEIIEIEEDKKKLANDMNETYNRFISKSKKSFSNVVKNIRSKEEKHEN